MKSAIIAVLFILTSLMNAGCERRRYADRSPDGACELIVSNALHNPFSIDPRLLVTVGCAPGNSLIFRGSDDWVTRRVVNVWSPNSKQVTFVACSYITKPISLTYDLAAHKIVVEPDQKEALRKKIVSELGETPPPGCPKDSDSLYWPCCSSSSKDEIAVR